MKEMKIQLNNEKNKMIRYDTVYSHWMVTSSMVTSISPSLVSWCATVCSAAWIIMTTIDAPIAQYIVFTTYSVAWIIHNDDYQCSYSNVACNNHYM